MPEIRLELLADLNKGHRTKKKSTLVPKYIAKITASKLNTLMKYEASGKKHPFKIANDSVLVLDETAQRGITDAGKVRQEESKVKDIKTSLLGVNKLAPKAFLGTLVWNVREQGAEVFQTITSLRDGKPPRLDLEFNPKRVYLTDSAHRHIGICEAIKEYSANPKEYQSAFDPSYEFIVEIYNLKVSDEKLLFSELNAKQKKITAAKAKEIDSISPIGRLKDHILAYDQANDRLFSQNIEVTSNQNDRHTLMTMSVFTASIKAMFGLTLIKESMEDEDLQRELSEYYCNFFYKLRDEIRVNCTIRGRDQEVRPFESLYLKYIYEAENLDTATDEELEEKVDKARAKALNVNKIIREQDKINSNPFIRSLSLVGGRIRKMADWEGVIENLQANIIAPSQGRFFQTGNPEMLRIDPETNHPIATEKDDGSLNVQVQTHTLRTIENFLMAKLELKRFSTITVQTPNGEELIHPLKINRAKNTFLDLTLQFHTGNDVDVRAQDILVRIDPTLQNGDWKKARIVGQSRPCADEVVVAAGYEDPSYPNSINRHIAKFEIDLPPFDSEETDQFELQFECQFPGLSGDSTTTKVVLLVQAEQD